MVYNLQARASDDKRPHSAHIVADIYISIAGDLMNKRASPSGRCELYEES